MPETDQIKLEIDTPIGILKLFARSDRLIRIELSCKNRPSHGNSSYRIGSRDDPAFREAVDFIDRYFSGEHVSWAGKNLPLGSDFFVRVWAETVNIPYGEIISYGELASRAGSPGAARAVGSAMARNPLQILVPCHRVVAADGRISDYGGGLDIKRWLLQHEGVDF